MSRVDRSHWKVVKKKKMSEDDGVDEDVMSLTPEERVEMVWEITKNAWAFTGAPFDTRLQRHIGRVIRRGR